MNKDKGSFAKLGKNILEAGKPTGLSDFLDTSEDNENVRKSVSTEIRKTVSTESRTKTTSSLVKKAREEFRFTEELAERLRRYAFDKRMKKTDVATKALEELLDREGY